MKKTTKKSHPFHRLMRLMEEQLAFVLAGLAVLAFIFSYSFAATPAQDVAMSSTAVAISDTPVNGIMPAGSTHLYQGIEFSTHSASGFISARTAGQFSQPDVAFTSDGTYSGSDGITYSYTLDLAASPQSAKYYVDGYARSITINGHDASNGVDLAGSSQIKITWKEGVIKRLSQTPGSTGTAAPAVSKPVSSLFLLPVIGKAIVGGTLQLIPTALDASGSSTNVNPTWSVSNSDIATINSTGLLTALKAGAVTVTAHVGAVSASATVTVMAQAQSVAPIAAPAVSTPSTSTSTATSTPAASTSTATSTSAKTVTCPAGWIGTDCSISATPASPDKISPDKVEASKSVATTVTTILNQTAAVAQAQGARLLADITKATFSATAVAARVAATGSIYPSQAEIRAIASTQPTASLKFATTVALTTKTVLNQIGNLVGGLILGGSKNQPTPGTNASTPGACPGCGDAN